MSASACRAWYEGDPILEEYHDHEWCQVNHDDRFQFDQDTVDVLNTELNGFNKTKIAEAIVMAI